MEAKKMYSFKNDYSEGAHQNILRVLTESNLIQGAGYGEDDYCKEAGRLIKEKIARQDADIHFLSGGTQTNLTAISAFLRPHEAVIAAHTGHIATHETGAIEATGHKVITVNVEDGKLKAHHILSVLEEHTDEHMVKPKMVYLSNSTEVGTIYKKDELKAMSKLCKDKGLYLYVDGARLGSALCAKENDLTFEDLGALTDAFYIGGTKNGALLGEALVIIRDELKEDFRYHIKQKGGMLAKGRILGIQFVELFKDNLYFELARHANSMAEILKEGISSLGYSFLIDSPTNQIFPIFPNEIIKKLCQNYDFQMWQKVDENYLVVRLVTSWATPKEAVEDFIKCLKELHA